MCYNKLYQATKQCANCMTEHNKCTFYSPDVMVCSYSIENTLYFIGLIHINT